MFEQQEQQQQQQFLSTIKSKCRQATTIKCTSKKTCQQQQKRAMVVLHPTFVDRRCSFLLLLFLLSIHIVGSLSFMNNFIQKKQQYCSCHRTLATSTTYTTSTNLLFKNIVHNKIINHSNNRKQSTCLFSLSRIIIQLDRMKRTRQDNTRSTSSLFLSSINDNDIEGFESNTTGSNVQGMATFLSNRLGWVVVRTIQQKKQQESQQQSVSDDTNNIVASSSSTATSTISNMDEIEEIKSMANNIKNDITASTASTAITEMEDITLDSIPSTTSSSTSSSETAVESNSFSITDANANTATTTATTDDDNDDDVDQSATSSASSSFQPESPLYVPNIPSVISLGHGKALSVTESNVVPLREVGK